MRHSSWNPALRWIVLLPSYSVVLLVRLLKWSVAPAALAAQLAIGVPLGLRRFKVPMEPRFTPVAEQDLPDAAWLALTAAAESLAPEDFIVRGDFRCDQLLREGVIWLRLLDHPTSGIQAMAVQITLKTGVRPIRRFVEFSTEFRDGRVLLTTHRDLPYSLPPPHYLARIQLKDVWEPRALHGLHRDLVASLGQPVEPFQAANADDDPVARLTERHARQLRALLDRGWLRRDAEPGHVRLTPQAALVSVWRQAWPLRSVYLRAADARSRRLLARHGLDVRQFTGNATTVIVGRQPVSAGPINGVRAGYAHAQILAQQTDPRAALEAVVVELRDENPDGATVAAEFRYSFRSYQDETRRRIRRHVSFDLVLDPRAGVLSVTAAERESDRALDDAEWDAMTARAPFEPLEFDPWMRDLEHVLPAAQTAFARADAKRSRLDSASLFLDNRRLCWQVVAWSDDDTPLFVIMDARSGAVLNP